MRSELAKRDAEWSLDAVLDRYDLSIRPSKLGETVLAGGVDFTVQIPDIGSVTDSFDVEIRIPLGFPKRLPSVRETGGRIPTDFHQLNDGGLCLGSPLRIASIVSGASPLLALVEKCVVPYLAGFSAYQRTGKMPFGELAHGAPGLFDDYRRIFNVDTDEACVEYLQLLSVRKRVANKHRCPCGKKRLGQCHNLTLNRFRSLAPRSSFAAMRFQLERSLRGERGQAGSLSGCTAPQK